ncbi:MAG TPA: hypothetical protein DIC30_06320 [Oceanospirillales bacterium]|nr:hypothetical protein [Oceanospirillales bacterium]
MVKFKNRNAGKKIAILGGGLCGRLLAWRIASISSMETVDNGIIEDIGIKNIELHVFEKGSLNPNLNTTDKASAFTAAAMLSPSSELVSSELEIFQLGQRSLTLWPKWLKQINGQQYFHQRGSLVIAHPNDLAELRQFEKDLRFKLQQLSTKQPSTKQIKTSQYQLIQSQQQLNVLEPNLGNHFQQGLFLQDEAHIDHHPVLNKLIEEAQVLDVQFHQHQPMDIDDPKLSDFDLIFDCRGFGSKQSSNDQAQIRGVRGEVIWLESKEITLTRPIRIMHPRYKLYLVPKPNNQFMIGATEIESEDQSPISLRSSMELMSALYAINPAFSEARILYQDQNLRPAYFDNLPKIQQSESKRQQPVISINGLYRHGYLIGPALIEQAIEKVFS